MWSQLTSNDVETSKIRSIVEDGMVLNVGTGVSILFWHDKWCENGPLKRAFPRLFSISSQKNFFIEQVGWWHEECWKWSLIWRRPLYDWEVEELSELEAAINLNTPQKNAVDD